MATVPARLDGSSGEGARHVGEEVAAPSLRWPAVARTAAQAYVLIVVPLTAFGLVLTKLLLDGPVGRFDDRIPSWLSEHRTPLLGRLTDVVTRSSDTQGAVAITLLLCGLLALARRWQAVGVVALGLALELSCFLTVGFVVDRPRPAVPRIGALPSTSSFPSGHTAATVVIYSSMAIAVCSLTRNRVARAAAWSVAILMALFVAYARVYRGMHHPLDVTAGLVLGAMAVLAAVRAFPGARTEPAPADGAT